MIDRICQMIEKYKIPNLQHSEESQDLYMPELYVNRNDYLCVKESIDLLKLSNISMTMSMRRSIGYYYLRREEKDAEIRGQIKDLHSVRKEKQYENINLLTVPT